MPNYEFRAYQPFAPPEHLAKNRPIEWSVADAHRYLTWLTSVLDHRVDRMLEYLGEDAHGDPEQLISRVAQRAMWILRKPEFSTVGHESMQLTEPGYSLAADLGLLVAKCLMAANPEIQWRVLRRPKSEVSFNQPVLVGFGKVHLDPIRGSVVAALHCLKGKGDSDVWRRMFAHWTQLARDTCATRKH